MRDKIVLTTVEKIDYSINIANCTLTEKDWNDFVFSMKDSFLFKGLKMEFIFDEGVIKDLNIDYGVNTDASKLEQDAIILQEFLAKHGLKFDIEFIITHNVELEPEDDFTFKKIQMIIIDTEAVRVSNASIVFDSFKAVNK